MDLVILHADAGVGVVLHVVDGAILRAGVGRDAARGSAIVSEGATGLP